MLPSHYKRGIFFAEKPATAAELSVAEVIRDLYAAREEKNVEKVLSLYDPEAIIYTLAKQKIDLPQYKKFIGENMRDLRYTCFDEVVIRVKSQATAIVASLAHYCYRDKLVGPAQIIFTLKKMDGKWVIVLSEWVS